MARAVSADQKRALDTARAQHDASQTGTQHADVPKNYWTQQAPSQLFGRERFRVWWVPGSGSKQNIDANVEGLTWDDATAVLTGTMQMRDPAHGTVPDIGFGDEIMCEVAPTGSSSFIELWRLRIDAPSRDFQPSERSFQLVNALGWLSRSDDDFHYAKDKAHPKGWFAHEVVLDIATKYRVPVGVIAMTTHRIQKLVVLQGTPLDVIAAAYKRERQYTGKRFVISCDHGKLNVTPLQRSQRLLELGPSLISASFQEQMMTDFATEVTVRATGKVDKGKDKKGKKLTGTGKIVVVVQSPTAVARFGYVHREVWAHDADSTAGARAAGLRHLTLVGKPSYTFTATHPGLPFLRRGDAIQALLPEQALRQVIFVTEARHTLSASDYQMEVSVTFADPFVDAKIDQVDENRYATARVRGRKTKAKTTKTTKPPGASQRKNKATPGQRLTGRGHPQVGVS